MGMARIRIMRMSVLITSRLDVICFMAFTHWLVIVHEVFRSVVISKARDCLELNLPKILSLWFLLIDPQKELVLYHVVHNFFLTVSKDGKLNLWDAKNAKLVYHWPKLHDRHTFIQPSSRGFGGVVRADVTDIQVVSNGFLSCGGDGTVKLGDTGMKGGFVIRVASSADLYNDSANGKKILVTTYCIHFWPKAITPDEPIEEPDNSLSMGDEHLSTIPETESDKVIKSGVENLVPILSEFEGISDDTCDVALDDDDFKVVEEYVSLNKRVNVEKEFDLEDIFQIQDVILREKLLNISRLVTNIESLKDNPTLDCVLKSPSSFPIPIVDSDSFFEESDTSFSYSDNSLPEFKTFSDHTEETRSGSTTTHANNSLPEYDSFLFEIEPDQGGLISIVISDNSNDPLLELPEFESFHFDPSFPRPPPEPPDVEISLIIETDAPVINNVDELNEDECFDPGGVEINVEVDISFTFVIRTFLPFLTYPEVSPLLSSTKNEDTIFDPGIST
ncbi:putative reverse transcriptase domain-containing protein [Tanacetum coccineum]